jgi:hypothetical protein
MKETNNNDKYARLMKSYKKARRNPDNRNKALKLLRAAQKMDIDGLVSEEVVNAWRYID